MNALRYFFKNSPQWRIYRLYIASLLVLLWVGVAYFSAEYVMLRVARISAFSEFVLAVTAPTLADDILGNKTDLIQPSLDAMAASPFIGALTIASPNGEVRWQSKGALATLAAPQWLNTWLQGQLPDIQKPLQGAGRVLGTLRISTETESLANEIWYLIWTSWLFAAVLACLGVLLGLVPLSRALAEMFALGQQANVTLNAISEGVITCNEHFELISINPAAQCLLGFSASDKPGLLGKDVRELLPKLFFANEVTSNWGSRDHVFERKDGEHVMLETGLVDVQGSEEQSLIKVLTLRDVSQTHALLSAQSAELLAHKHAIASMKSVADSLPLSTLIDSSHQSLSGIAELNYLTAWVLAVVADRERSRLELEYQKYAIDQHAIVVMCTMEGVSIYINDRYCQISGYERAELLGQKARLQSVRDNAEDYEMEMLETVSKGNVWRGKLQSQNRQGQHYWVNATVVPLYNEFFVQDRYMLIGTDITQDEQNKAQLSEQLNLMAVLLEAIPTAIYFKDSLGRYSVVNPAFEKLFGLSSALLLGNTVIDHVPPSFALFAIQKDQALLAEGGVQIFETPFVNQLTGRQADFLYSKALTTDHQGHITGIVGAIQDVTERNLNQRQLEHATRLAEAANRAKSNFLANMSHEIRTPMNGVIGMVELALEMAVDPSQRDYLRLAKISSQSLMVVINDILDISKIEANQVDIESIEFSLTDVIAHSFKPVEAMAKKKGLIFELELGPDLPDHVMGDPTRLRQVLLNLCDNAIKFTNKGQVIVRVTGTPMVDDAFELTVAVMDTGIGIAIEAQGTIFELFNQADTSTTRKYGGSGLGLTISMKLATLMGGHITLASAIGQGSTFTLRLRLSLPKSVLQVVAMPAGASVLLPSAPKSVIPTALQVLLVEDNLVNQILCCTILKKIGHTVVVANHGQEALDLLGTQPWDVILMDMQMPVMDGLEATRAIRARELPGQRIPIVAMTANAMETDRQLCLDTGMDDYLSKPFKFAELQAILEKAIGGN